MNRWTPRLLAACAGLWSMTGALAQQPPSRAMLEGLFPKGAPVCFARYYDAAHLKRHPAQSVTSVRLMRGFQQVRGDAERNPADAITIELIVTYRDSGARRFLGDAGCGPSLDNQITCYSSSCDGGSFPVKVEDADTILIGGAQGRSRFSVSGGCGDDGPGRSLGRSADDTVFRLTRMPISACR